MSKKTPQLISPEAVEAAFYEAMQQADIERLMACWADDEDVVCVHPGGPRVLGLAAVRTAFAALFAEGPVRVFPDKVHRAVHDNVQLHSVVERVELLSDDGLQKAWVLATNVYVQTALGWRMVAHHASPGMRVEPTQPVDVPPVLH